MGSSVDRNIFIASTTRWRRRSASYPTLSMYTVFELFALTWVPAIRWSASCTDSTSRCRDDSKTTSPFLGSMAISRCTPRCSARKACRWKYKFERVIWTVWRSPVLHLTGSIEPTKSRTQARSVGHVSGYQILTSFNSQARRKSFSRASRSICFQTRYMSLHPRVTSCHYPKARQQWTLHTRYTPTLVIAV